MPTCRTDTHARGLVYRCASRTTRTGIIIAEMTSGADKGKRFMANTVQGDVRVTVSACVSAFERAHCPSNGKMCQHVCVWEDMVWYGMVL